MSERDGYEPDVPCWVAAVHSDPEKAVSFYTQLFGWEATNLMPPEAPGKYFVCRRRGRDVAAIGSERGGGGGGAPSVPAWDTYIWAESADETLAKVTDAGGSVVVEPFDRLDAARMAVVAGVGRPGEEIIALGEELSTNLIVLGSKGSGSATARHRKRLRQRRSQRALSGVGSA